MFGQGSPRLWSDLSNRVASACARLRCARLGIGALAFGLCWALLSLPSHAEETTVRLRFAWGGSDQEKQRWTGQIAVEGGTFADLQPLGVEADASVSLRTEGNRLVIDPLEKRSFDG